MKYTLRAVSSAGAPIEVSHLTLGHCLSWLNWRESVDQAPILAPDAPFELRRDGALLTRQWRRHYSRVAPVLTGLGTPLDLLVEMIHELRSLALNPENPRCVRLPREMEVDLWEAITTIRSAAYGSIPCFDSHGYELTHAMEKAFKAAFGYASDGPPYDPDGQHNARHAVHVAHGLARGAYVSDEALAHYQIAGMPSDLSWANELVHKRYLRGAFRSADECSIVLSLLKRAGVVLDEPNARKVLVDLRQHTRHPISNHVEGDDALFASGWLQQRALPQSTDRDVPPTSPLAELVHREVLAENLKNGLRALEEEKSRLSMREYLYRKLALERASQSRDAGWANRVATTVLTKDLRGMLTILDGTHNVASQRACEQHFGVKLRGLKAKARRLAVFKLAGIEGDLAVAAAEDALDAADEAAKLEQRLEFARKRVAEHMVRNGGELYTGDEWLRHLVETGYNKLVERKSGTSARYYLTDGQGSGWALSVSKGYYDYAVAYLDSLVAKQRETKGRAQAQPA